MFNNGGQVNTLHKQEQRYLLFIRHGALDRSASKKDDEQCLDSIGVKTAYETASILGEQLESEGIKRVIIWCSRYRYNREHADIVKTALKDRGLSVDCLEKDELNPSVFRHWDRKRLTNFADEIKNNLQKISENEALLLVGHQPQLGWLGEQLHDVVPIASSEIICLRLYISRVLNLLKWNSSQLLWSIASTDLTASELLNDKIKWKMATARLLSTSLTLLLGIMLSGLIYIGKLKLLTASDEPSRIIFGSLSRIELESLNTIYLYIIIISIICLFIAVVFYLISMYAYDRLLMPTRFWAQGFTTYSPRWLPQRPPSSSLLVQQVNMMRIWRLFFTPATVFVLLSLIGFALVVMRVDPLEYILWVMLLSLCVYFYYRYARLCLGADD